MRTPIIYLLIYRKMKETNKDYFITTHEALCLLSRNVPMTRNGIKHQILKDMQNWGLIEKKTKFGYYIKEGDDDKILDKYGYVLW